MVSYASPEQVEIDVRDELLEPEGKADGEQRIVDYTTFFFPAHGVFARRLICGPTLKSYSRAFVSLCEVDGNNVPFRGLATMSVANVVPHDDGILELVGSIQWNSDIKVRASVLWQ
ncbi:hypothetical protein ABT040_39490 [Streptomyces sp. NPDC002688]|uniref:hypothetical protein n=1 Tax=Streptomyces sp. NPDC002688 TaxID=3154423 RepID=UPI00332CEF0E